MRSAANRQESVVKMGSAYRIVREEVVREPNGATYKTLIPVSGEEYATREEAEVDVK